MALVSLYSLSGIYLCVACYFNMSFVTYAYAIMHSATLNYSFWQLNIMSL